MIDPLINLVSDWVPKIALGAFITSVLTHWDKVERFYKWVRGAPEFKWEINESLIDRASPDIWVRGKVTNPKEVLAEACMVKVTAVDGNLGLQNFQAVYLQWQGGETHVDNIVAHDDKIFDIGVVSRRKAGPFIILGRLGTQHIDQPLSPGEYDLRLKLLSKNFRPSMKVLHITVLGDGDKQILIR